MISAFQYYGSSEDVLREVKYRVSDNKYQSMLEQMTPEWRNAVMYVLGRTNVQIYIDGMYEAFEAGNLTKIAPESVKAGSSEFINIIRSA